MGLFDWLRGNRQPRDEYAATERRLLLKDAANIRKSRNILDEQMAVNMGLASTIAALRQQFGYAAVESNCPAEQIISAYAGQGDMGRASRMLDDLVRDIKALKTDKNRTWLRMAVMLNPRALRTGAHAACSLTGVDNPRGDLPPLSAEMQETVTTTISTCARQIDQCFGQGVGMPYVSERVDDIVATYALGFLQGLFLINHADILWAKGNRNIADCGWFVCATGMIPALLHDHLGSEAEVDQAIERASSCQHRLPQLQGQEVTRDWYKIEEAGAADAMEFVKASATPERGRLVAILKSNLTPEQMAAVRTKARHTPSTAAEGSKPRHKAPSRTSPSGGRKAVYQKKASELVENLKRADQSRKDAQKRKLRAELAAYTNSRLTTAGEHHLGLLAEYALLKAVSEPKSRALVWRIDVTYRECLRRKRADVWFEAKGRIKALTREIPTWIDEREDALENERIERLWTKIPEV